MHALLIWQYLNAKFEDEKSGRYSKNFLIVAPGLIVYNRLLDAYLGKENEKRVRINSIISIPPKANPNNLLKSNSIFSESRLILSNIITKRKRTITPPAYNNICIIATKSADKSTYKPLKANITNTNDNTEYIGFLANITDNEKNIDTTANIQNTTFSI
jgi:hypothetical protein